MTVIVPFPLIFRYICLLASHLVYIWKTAPLFIRRIGRNCDFIKLSLLYSQLWQLWIHTNAERNIRINQVFYWSMEVAHWLLTTNRALPQLLFTSTTFCALFPSISQSDTDYRLLYKPTNVPNMLSCIDHLCINLLNCSETHETIRGGSVKSHAVSSQRKDIIVKLSQSFP